MLLAKISGQMLLEGYTLDVVSSDVANLVLVLLAEVTNLMLLTYRQMMLIEDVLPSKCSC